MRQATALHRHQKQNLNQLTGKKLQQVPISTLSEENCFPFFPRLSEILVVVFFHILLLYLFTIPDIT